MDVPPTDFMVWARCYNNILHLLGKIENNFVVLLLVCTICLNNIKAYEYNDCLIYRFQRFYYMDNIEEKYSEKNKQFVFISKINMM